VPRAEDGAPGRRRHGALLRLPANERLQFLAGQYIEFLLKDGARRSFSMGNAPHDDELIQLHVRRVAGGQFTDHVFGKMKERDILRLEGPLGTFFLREESAKPIVLVASGTGFAPIKSIIENALHKGVTGRWCCIGAEGGRRICTWNDARPPMADPVRPRRFGCAPERPLDRAHRLRAPRRDAGLPRPLGYQVYACGVPAMVDAAKRDFTQQCKLPEEEFFADSFTTQADLASPK
jgi:CDP-4-dehydro-6-deoxyglucose reductase